MSKKILLLGGSRFALPVIESAHKLDCEIITCDYLPDNTAHKYSDGYENISIIDKDAVLRTAERLEVDGIMSFACDPGVVAAAYAAEKMGLPSPGPFESVCILQNKKKFRKFLSDHGFNVPAAKGYKNIKEALDDAGMYRWPVIVKPADSAGSKGVSRADCPGELKNAISRALENSVSGEFIIEDFLECKGCPSDSESFSADGSLKFVSYSAQMFDRQCGNPYVPAGFTWRPTISENHRKDLMEELQRLMKLLHMGTSIYNVEVRECTDGRAYIMEVSPRGGGNRLAEMLKHVAGIDLVEYAVKAALGEKIPEIFPCFTEGNWAEIILHGRHEGRFRNLRLSEEISRNLVEKDLWIKQGDYIEKFSGANKAVGTLVMHFQDKKLMDDVMENPYRYITIEAE